MYGEGGKFLTHRDTEKEVGMFGTLVIVLPSLHMREDLVAQGNRNATSIVTRGEWMAFYADCEHELEVVESGFRLALVYNLVSSNKVEQDVLFDDEKFRPLLAELEEKYVETFGQSGMRVAFLLDHEYSERGLQALQTSKELMRFWFHPSQRRGAV